MSHTIYLHRSIPLRKETFAAWKSVTEIQHLNTEAVFLKHRPPQEQAALLEKLMPRTNAFFINLGDTSFTKDLFTPNFLQASTEEGRLWNLAEDIYPIVTPGETRRTLGEFLPPQPTTFPADTWLKPPGRHGNGKQRRTITEFPSLIRDSWDIQTHVDGEEYRVITTGHKVVQVQQQIDNSDPTNRIYIWCGLQGAPKQVKRVARAAAKYLSPQTIVGWDIIHNTEQNIAYILEGNSCPGVNSATAKRITSALVQAQNGEQ